MSASAAGMAGACGAVALGCLYLVMAGAPARMVIVNAAALLIGLSAVMLLRALRGLRIDLAGPALIAASLSLIATALFGQSSEGVARWVSIGSLTVQPSLLFVPMLIVAAARRLTAASAAAILIAVVAVALQPDQAGSAMLAAGAAAIAFSRPGRVSFALFAAAVAGFAVTLARPDRLPPVPFVEHVYWSSFGVHPLAGLAVVLGTLLLFAPLLLAWDRPQRPALLAFAGAWLAAAAAAALGDYPTPVVGFGGSAILGYLLSVAMLAPRATHPSAHRMALDRASKAARDSESWLQIA